MAGSRSNLHTVVPRWACIQDMLKIKIEVKGQAIPAHLGFHKNCFFSHANNCILTKLCLSPTSPSLCAFGFLLHPNPQMAVSLRCEFHHIAHMVKQFVKLFAIQYGLTFCLYVRSLYEAPLHSPSRLSISQLDLMSKSWNELLRHWRSRLLHVAVKSYNTQKAAIHIIPGTRHRPSILIPSPSFPKDFQGLLTDPPAHGCTLINKLWCHLKENNYRNKNLPELSACQISLHDQLCPTNLLTASNQESNFLCFHVIWFSYLINSSLWHSVSKSKVTNLDGST